jgi:hypothetical protein
MANEVEVFIPCEVLTVRIGTARPTGATQSGDGPTSFGLGR